MPVFTFDNLLLVSFVFPLTAAAIPLCATAKTLDDWVSCEPDELISLSLPSFPSLSSRFFLPRLTSPSLLSLRYSLY